MSEQTLNNENILAIIVEVRCERDELRVCGNGWSIPEELLIDCSRSSQFATAILINAWGLDEDLNLRLQGLARSRGYWNMSVALVRAMGMDLQISGDRVRVPARSKVTPSVYEAELDMDSAFALAAATALSPKSSLELVDFPLESLQPSAVFVKTRPFATW